MCAANLHEKFCQSHKKNSLVIKVQKNAGKNQPNVDVQNAEQTVLNTEFPGQMLERLISTDDFMIVTIHKLT